MLVAAIAVIGRLRKSRNNRYTQIGMIHHGQGGKGNCMTHSVNLRYQIADIITEPLTTYQQKNVFLLKYTILTFHLF